MALFYVFTFCMLLGCVVMEPACSRYDYEEKLLNKLIKMEFEWRALQDDVKTSLANLKTELSNARQEISGTVIDVKNILNDTEAERAKITNLVEQQKDETLGIVRGQEGQITELRHSFVDFTQMISRNLSDLGATTMVAFNARDVKHLNLAKGDTIILTTNLLNEGNAYDNSTGIFTAPVSGLYMFTVQLCTEPGFYFSASVIVGGKEYGRCFSADADYQTCSSCQATVVMQSGDTALVRTIYSGGKRLFTGAYHEIFFTGTLINQPGSGSN